MTTSAVGANENALPKIDHFYPSDVHFYFKPSDNTPSITAAVLDVSGGRRWKGQLAQHGKCDGSGPSEPSFAYYRCS